MWPLHDIYMSTKTTDQCAGKHKGGPTPSPKLLPKKRARLPTAYMYTAGRSTGCVVGSVFIVLFNVFIASNVLRHFSDSDQNSLSSIYTLKTDSNRKRSLYIMEREFNCIIGIFKTRYSIRVLKRVGSVMTV